MYTNTNYTLNTQDLKEQLQQKKILVVGDIMLDRYWFGETNRISPEAPVPIIKIQKYEDRLGGAANVARNIANLGVQTSILGCIGIDEAGLRIKTLLTEDCVNAYLQEDSEYTSILKLRVLARKQQMLRLDFEEKLPQNLLQRIEKGFAQLISQYNLVVFSDYDKGCLESCENLITIAKQNNIPILVDPKGRSFTKYKGSTILTPNLKELSEVVGGWQNEEELNIKAQNLREQLQLEALLVTKSEQGMTLYTNTTIQNFHSQIQEVSDVSGAGDTVIATLASLMSVTNDIFISTEYANKAGGIVVGKLGTSSIEYNELFN